MGIYCAYINRYCHQVIRSLKRALQPAVTDVVVEFKVPEQFEVLQSPETIPPIFNGEKLVVYGILKSKSSPISHASGVAVLKGAMLGSGIKHNISFEIDSTSSEFPTIHHLAAKALIKDWERGNRQKEDIVELSVEMGVVSSHTSFIAVDEGNKEPIRGPMKTWDVVTQDAQADTLQQQVGAVRCAMQASIDRVLLRGDMLEDLNEMAADLSSSAMAFQRSAQSPKRSGGLLSGFSSLFSGLFGRSSPKMQLATYDSPVAMDASGSFEMPSEGGGVGDGGPAMPPFPHVGSPAPQPQASLSALVTLQQADGSWNLDESLAHELGKKREELEGACPVKCVGMMAMVWATVLALCVMKTRHSDKEEEWELVGTKAEGWLRRQPLPSDLTMEQLRAAARKCI